METLNDSKRLHACLNCGALIDPCAQYVNGFLPRTLELWCSQCDTISHIYPLGWPDCEVQHAVEV